MRDFSDHAVQIGPNVSGAGGGSCYSQNVNFFVGVSGDESVTYAWYSVDATNPSVPIANGETVNASGGGNDVQFRWDVPAGTEIKLVIDAQ